RQSRTTGPRTSPAGGRTRSSSSAPPKQDRRVLGRQHQPDAAYQAISGSVSLQQVTEAGLFTDGITRLLDWYGYTWPVILSSLRSEGPASLITLVRAARTRTAPPLRQAA